MGPYWYRDKLFGDLGVLELNEIPFEPKRIYWVTNFIPGVSRGNHAHRTLRQAFLVLQGSVVFQIFEGRECTEIQLDEGGKGFIMPPASWRTFSSNTNSSVLLVICDQPFNQLDYIRDWEAYLEWHDEINGN